MRPGGHSEAVEMYLKSLAVLGGADRAIPAAQIADRLAVSAVATNEMLRRLVRDDLVGHEPYRGYELTAAGRAAAWDVIRRERIWERFLADQLGLAPAAAVAAACQLEHATSPEVIDALDAFLGHPPTCPLGHPIPRTPTDPVAWPDATLADAEPEEELRLLAFGEDDPEVLDWLDRHGLAVGSVVRVVEVAPHHSSTTVAHDGGSLVLGREIAGAVQVAATDPASRPAGAATVPASLPAGAAR
jgi:DtxR family Mn-dependent transcriptional regulator